MFTSARDLGVAARLVAFGLGLLVVGILAALAGAATGDRREPAAKDGADMAMEEMSSAEQSRASGLVSATAGYTFAPERTTLPRERPPRSGSGSSTSMATLSGMSTSTAASGSI